MRYRLYQSGDFASLYSIEKVCFPPPLRFPREYMRQLVANPRGATWIAEDGGNMTGFAIVEWPQTDARILAYIATLEVSPAFRRQGVGGELLRRLEGSALNAGAALIWLHVDAENTSAIRIYETHGYICQGREENYYAHGRAACIYAKMLTPART
jgi:ribosomal-protein-alanine N-acetyltransferase